MKLPWRARAKDWEAMVGWSMASISARCVAYTSSRNNLLALLFSESARAVPELREDNELKVIRKVRPISEHMWAAQLVSE